jgi:hypothetical protein
MRVFEKRYTIKWNNESNRWYGQMGEGQPFITMAKTDYKITIDDLLVVYHCARVDGYLDINQPVQVDHHSHIYDVSQVFSKTGKLQTIFSWSA